jgi:hypothetical protein
MRSVEAELAAAQPESKALELAAVEQEIARESAVAPAAAAAPPSKATYTAAAALAAGQGASAAKVDAYASLMAELDSRITAAANSKSTAPATGVAAGGGGGGGAADELSVALQSGSVLEFAAKLKTAGIKGKGAAASCVAGAKSSVRDKFAKAHAKVFGAGESIVDHAARVAANKRKFEAAQATVSASLAGKHKPTAQAKGTAVGAAPAPRAIVVVKKKTVATGGPAAHHSAVAVAVAVGDENKRPHPNLPAAAPRPTTTAPAVALSSKTPKAARIAPHGPAHGTTATAAAAVVKPKVPAPRSKTPGAGPRPKPATAHAAAPAAVHGISKPKTAAGAAALFSPVVRSSAANKKAAALSAGIAPMALAYVLSCPAQCSAVQC